ncbi:MAG: HAMP domain-containing sensor histidine kinase [Cyanobacteria bacterium P01_D01_bin.73]
MKRSSQDFSSKDSEDAAHCDAGRPMPERSMEERSLRKLNLWGMGLRSRNLQARLLLSHLAVLVVGLGIFVGVGLVSSPQLFVVQLERLEIAGFQISRARRQLIRGFDLVWRQSSFWSAIAGAATAGGVSFWASRRIVRPLKEMEAVTRQLAAGDLEARVRAYDIAELDQVGQSFNVMADSLAGVEQRRRQLVGDLTHELRSPLTVMRGYLEELASDAIEPSPELYGRLVRETRRLERLVRDTQELSKVEAGHLPLNIQPISGESLRELITGLVDQLRDQVVEEELTLAVDLPQDLPSVAADGDRLHQILVNLLSNALRHTSTGTVTVWARRSPVVFEHPAQVPDEADTADNTQRSKSLWLGVTDTGEGMAAENLLYIFERFWRGDLSRDRQIEPNTQPGRTSGAGIGLAITKQLVERHGGKIVAISEHHRGSTFYFDLPLAKTGWK